MKKRLFDGDLIDHFDGCKKTAKEMLKRFKDDDTAEETSESETSTESQEETLECIVEAEESITVIQEQLKVTKAKMEAYSSKDSSI